MEKFKLIVALTCSLALALVGCSSVSDETALPTSETNTTNETIAPVTASSSTENLMLETPSTQPKAPIEDEEMYSSSEESVLYFTGSFKAETEEGWKLEASYEIGSDDGFSPVVRDAPPKMTYVAAQTWSVTRVTNKTEGRVLDAPYVDFDAFAAYKKDDSLCDPNLTTSGGFIDGYGVSLLTLRSGQEYCMVALHAGASFGLLQLEPEEEGTASDYGTGDVTLGQFKESKKMDAYLNKPEFMGIMASSLGYEFDKGCAATANRFDSSKEAKDVWMIPTDKSMCKK